MASSNKLSRKQKTEEKANYLFLFYKMMGPDRSLKKLAEYGIAAGLKISEKTLLRYSGQYEWQRKLIEQQAADNEKNEQEVSKIVQTMNERQAQFGQALQTMAQVGLQSKIEAIRNKKPVAFDFKDITSLYRVGQIGERLARGQATSREEIKVEIMNIVVQEFAVIFLSVYTIEDREVMKQEYIRRFNDLLKIYFPTAKNERIGP